MAFELPRSLAEDSEVGGEVKKEDVRHSEDELLEDRISDDVGLKAFRPCSDSCLILNCRPINPKPNFVYLSFYSIPQSVDESFYKSRRSLTGDMRPQIYLSYARSQEIWQTHLKYTRLVSEEMVCRTDGTVLGIEKVVKFNGQNPLSPSSPPS